MQSQGLVVIFAATSCFVLLAGYTKVEESFNVQAIHDIVSFGISPSALQHYDHLEFPGVVPRSFLGALVVSACSYVPLQLIELLGFGSGLSQQLVVRLVLGLLNSVALDHTRRTMLRTRGQTAGYFFLALQITQFHVMYYAGRTLPNMMALPLSTIATNIILDPSGDVHMAVFLLACTTIIFRAEILILVVTTVSWHLLVTRRLALVRTIKTGLVAGLVSLALSFAIDSYFWRYPVVPELSGFYFNAVQGKSDEWGISPWYQYALDVVKLLLNPLCLPLLLPAAVLADSSAVHVAMPLLAFVALYSVQPHKEWRFIVYIIPSLTALCAVGSAYIYERRSRNVCYRLLTAGVLASIPCTGLLSLTMAYVSTLNYPGGDAMAKIPAGSSAYLDVLTCMTGSTRFLQDHGNFSRTEDVKVLSTVGFWNSLSHASVADTTIVERVYSSQGLAYPWRTIDTVYAFDHLSFRDGYSSLGIKKKPKLFILENRDRV